MSIYAEYKAARSRFVISEVQRDGVAMLQVHDPVRNLTAAVPLADRRHLMWLFRSLWIGDQNYFAPIVSHVALAGAIVAMVVAVVWVTL